MRAEINHMINYLWDRGNADGTCKEENLNVMAIPVQGTDSGGLVAFSSGLVLCKALCFHLVHPAGLFITAHDCSCQNG